MKQTLKQHISKNIIFYCKISKKTIFYELLWPFDSEKLLLTPSPPQNGAQHACEYIYHVSYLNVLCF